jgi:hypothetical protein
MWLKLSNREGITVLVATDKITHISAREGGGSSIYFEAETAEGRPRILAVRETIDDLGGLLNPGKK